MYDAERLRLLQEMFSVAGSIVSPTPSETTDSWRFDPARKDVTGLYLRMAQRHADDELWKLFDAVGMNALRVANATDATRDVARQELASAIAKALSGTTLDRHELQPTFLPSPRCQRSRCRRDDR